jgi:hypothetical protein
MTLMENRSKETCHLLLLPLELSPLLQVLSLLPQVPSLLPWVPNLLPRVPSLLLPVSQVASDVPPGTALSKALPLRTIRRCHPPEMIPATTNSSLNRGLLRLEDTTKIRAALSSSTRLPRVTGLVVPAETRVTPFAAAET